MPNSFQTYYHFFLSRLSHVRHRTKWPLRDHLDHVPLKPHAETNIFVNKIEPIIGSRVIPSSLLYSTQYTQGRARTTYTVSSKSWGLVVDSAKYWCMTLNANDRVGVWIVLLQGQCFIYWERSKWVFGDASSESKSHYFRLCVLCWAYVVDIETMLHVNS